MVLFAFLIFIRCRKKRRRKCSFQIKAECSITPQVTSTSFVTHADFSDMLNPANKESDLFKEKKTSGKSVLKLSILQSKVKMGFCHQWLASMAINVLDQTSLLQTIYSFSLTTI